MLIEAARLRQRLNGRRALRPEFSTIARHSLDASTSRTEGGILDSAQMKKKIALIVVGSLFAVVGLVVALFYLKAPSSSAFQGAAPRMARAAVYRWRH